MGMSWEQVRQWVLASTRAQGVPLLITDPVTVVNVGALLKPRTGLGKPDPLGQAGTAAASDHPQGLDPVGIEPAPTGGRVDDRVVQHRANNRRLTVKVQLRPRLA